MSCVSVKKLFNFDKTKTNINRLRNSAEDRTYLYYEQYFEAQGPCRQSMAMTDLQAESYTCHLITPVGGCLVGALCEETGALIDCFLTGLTCGVVDAQRINDEDESGCFQGCLGALGNGLGNCLGNIFACAPCILTYVICLPKNCCVHFCCPPTQEELEAKRQLITGERTNNILEDIGGPGLVRLWQDIKRN